MKGLRIVKLILMLAFADIVDAQSAIVKTDSFYSSSVQLNLKYTIILIILPDNYNKKSGKYPVVYLLHGHTGNYTSWIGYAKLPVSLATQYNCIIILPDAGNSWYVNWSGQTDGKPNRWEDMLVKDLIPDVDKKYRTLKEKKGRMIGGLSMGGFGALAIGLKNPNLFGFVFSSAGTIDFCKYIKEDLSKDTLDWDSPELWSEDIKTVDNPKFSDWKERTPHGIVFKKTSDADVYDPYLLLEKTDTTLLPFIHIDCGNKDYHLNAALNFTEILKKKTNIYSLLIMPGEYEIPYWEHAIRHTFFILSNHFLAK